MSMQLNALPASAGADASLCGDTSGRASSLFQRVIEAVREWATLRNQLAEVQNLSDRELSDIGLGEGEIYRLRRGEVFCPTRWSPENPTQDQLPI